MVVIHSACKFASINIARWWEFVRICNSHPKKKKKKSYSSSGGSSWRVFTEYSFILQCLIQPSLVAGFPAKVTNIIGFTPEGCIAHLKYCKAEQYFIEKTNETQLLDTKKMCNKRNPMFSVKHFVLFKGDSVGKRQMLVDNIILSFSHYI